MRRKTSSLRRPEETSDRPRLFRPFVGMARKLGQAGMVRWSGIDGRCWRRFKGSEEWTLFQSDIGSRCPGGWIKGVEHVVGRTSLPNGYRRVLPRPLRSSVACFVTWCLVKYRKRGDRSRAACNARLTCVPMTKPKACYLSGYTPPLMTPYLKPSLDRRCVRVLYGLVSRTFSVDFGRNWRDY